MSRRRRETVDPRQTRWTWSDAEAVLADAPDGEVVFDAEAPARSRLVMPRLRRAPRATGRHTVEPPSLGLPLGVAELEGRLTCFACACTLGPADFTSDSPRCHGCGASLPVR
jgi:hypothetical protein